MASVSGIEVRFSGNTTDLEKSVGRANNVISGFAKSAAAGLAGALSVGVFVAAGKAALNYADNIGKVAQKVGMTTEELSGLNYAAKLSDVSLQQLQTSLGIMARKMGDSADSFAAFGVAVKNNDGTLRSSNEVLLDIADRFAEMPNGVGKSQWALELFGRSGLDLIPLLNGGAASIAEMTAQAKLFGVVVSQEAAAGAETFNDNLTRLSEYTKGAVANFVTGMTPALVNVSSALVDSAKSTEIFKSAGEVAGRILETFARIVIVVSDNIDKLKGLMIAVAEVMLARYIFGVAAAFISFAKSVQAAGLVLTAFNAIRKISLAGFIAIAVGIAMATDNVENLKKGMTQIYDTASSMVPGLEAVGKSITDAFGIDLSGLQADLSAARKEIENGNVGGGSSVPAIPGKTNDGSADPKAPDQNPSREGGQSFADRLTMIQENFKTEQELLQQQYLEDQMALQAALDAKLIKETEYKDLSTKLAQEHSDALSQIQATRISTDLTAAQNFMGSMASIAQLGGKKMIKIAKAIGAAQAIISTLIAATDAMKVGLTPVEKFAAYAAVMAKGMAAVAAIKGVSDSGGGGGGGSGGGGGGSMGGGGGDGGGAARSSPTTTFAFTLTNDPMGFGEKFARQFIDQLNSTQRNGGQIRGVIA